MSLTLRPSEIYYCQNSINNVFHGYGPIGHTLDDIVDGNISVYDLPPIRVRQIRNRWFALDNRRLWIVKHLEEMGEIDEIDVEEISYIPPRKFTTRNNGESIVIRGDPDSRYVNDYSDDEDYDEDDDEDDYYESDYNNDSTDYFEDDYYLYDF